jgi:hypothetical protein
LSQEILKRVRRAVRQGSYKFTDHAIEEADHDGLSLNDIVEILLTGDLDSTYTDDLRGHRYVIRGEVDYLEADVVCRFQYAGNILIIITVYLADR